jgi:hypothetical protein
LKDKAGEDDSASGIDGDATVEDATLSSLGDGTRSDSAWLTALGRNDYVDDTASFPSRVILPKIDSNAELSVRSSHFDEFDVQSDHIKIMLLMEKRDKQLTSRTSLMVAN